MSREDVAGIRPLERADLPALASLCRKNLPLDEFTLPIIERRILADPRFCPDFSLLAVGAAGLLGAAIGVLRGIPEAGPAGWIKLFCVDEAARRRGLGRRVLFELERRFAAAGAATMTTIGAPHYFWPGVDIRYGAAAAFLEKLGFCDERVEVNMEVDLANSALDTAADEARLESEGFVIRRADDEALRRVSEFARPEWPEWAEEIRNARVNDPVSLFYAERDGRVAAFAAYDCAMFPGTFGPMGTARELRGLGLGRVLLRKCLADLRDRGHRRCEIAWVGPIAFYSRSVGARVSRVFRVLTKPLARSGF